MNPERTVLISSIGWVDRDTLWRFDAGAGRSEEIPLDSGARYVSLHSSGSADFAVAHHFDGVRLQAQGFPPEAETMPESFWTHLDTLVRSSELVIERPRGSTHPRHPAIV